MGANIAKSDTDAEMRMRVDHAGGSLEKVGLGEDFDEYGRAGGERIDHIHVAAVDTELGDARLYMGTGVIGGGGAAVTDLGVGDEGKPGGFAALGRMPGIYGIGSSQALAPK